MAITWNHPPNWPTPPQGWEPPDGWEPPADWPQPPANWEFWVDDTPATPTTAAPAAAEAFWSDDSLSPIPAAGTTPSIPVAAPMPAPEYPQGFATPPSLTDGNSEQWSDSSLSPATDVSTPPANGVDEDSYKPRWAVHDPADTPPEPSNAPASSMPPAAAPPTVATPPSTTPAPPPPPGGFMGGLAPDSGSSEEFTPPAFEGTFTPSSAGLAVAPADYSHITPIGRQGEYTPRPVFPGNDLYLWLLVASPVIVMLVQFAFQFLPPPLSLLYILTLPLPLVVNGVLGYLDLKQQAETGNPHKPPNLLWAIFLPWIYLPLRRQHSGENQLPFFGYIAALIATVIIASIVFAAAFANAMSGMSTSGGSVPGMDPNLVPPSSTGAIIPGP